MRPVPFEPLDPGVYRELVRRTLAEDFGWGDVTTGTSGIGGSVGSGGTVTSSSRGPAMSFRLATIRHEKRVAAQGDLRTAEGRAAIERFFAERHAGRIKGAPKVLVSPGHSFSDVAKKVVSIINLGSLAAIEDMVGSPVHPLRFRANVYVRGWPAWHEASLLGATIVIGSARLKVVKRITRCAAVNVDPDLAVRDMEIPSTLMRRFGNNECGIYAEVIEGGGIAVGDRVAVEQPAPV